MVYCHNNYFKEISNLSSLSTDFWVFFKCLHSQMQSRGKGRLEANSSIPVNSGWTGHIPRHWQVYQHATHTACVVSAPEHPQAVQPQLPQLPRSLVLFCPCEDGQILHFKNSETEAKICQTDLCLPWTQAVRKGMPKRSILCC